MYFQHNDEDMDYVTNYTSVDQAKSDNRPDLTNYVDKTYRHVNGKGQGSNNDLRIMTFDEWLTEKCSIVEEDYFQKFSLFLIILNTLLLGVATMDFVTDFSPTWMIFYWIDMFFVGLFTVELLMIVKYRGLQQFNDPWHAFDAILILSTWIFVTVPQLQDLPVLRALRLVVKVQEMRNLVAALVGATRRLFAVGLLLLLVFYIFAVVFTNLFKDLYEDGYTDEDYFSRLDKTFFTLFQFMTLDSWSSVTKDIMTEYNWAWLPICAFIVVSSFVVINLFIAVICDSVAEVQRREMEENLMQINSMLSMVEDKKDNDISQLEDKIDELRELIMELMIERKQHSD